MRVGSWQGGDSHEDIHATKQTSASTKGWDPAVDKQPPSCLFHLMRRMEVSTLWPTSGPSLILQLKLYWSTAKWES